MIAYTHQYSQFCPHCGRVSQRDYRYFCVACKKGQLWGNILYGYPPKRTIFFAGLPCRYEILPGLSVPAIFQSTGYVNNPFDEVATLCRSDTNERITVPFEKVRSAQGFPLSEQEVCS